MTFVSPPADLSSSLSWMQLLSDGTRLRLLFLLASEALSVAELTGITGLGQSRVSTHLGKLREAGLVHDRREGNSSRYRLREDMPEGARAIWSLLRRQVEDVVLQEDQRRRLARHETESWAERVAGAMERHYSPGRTWESLSHGLAGLLDLGRVLDIGCGDGFTASLLAPRCLRYVGVDQSAAILEAARSRLASQKNVEFHQGKMERLPVQDASFEQVLMFHVLTFASHPTNAILEAARALSPGGRLVLTTLQKHAHKKCTDAYGHRHLGFEPARLKAMLTGAGLDVVQCQLTSRETKIPQFGVLTAIAFKPSAPHDDRSPHQ